MSFKKSLLAAGLILGSTAANALVLGEIFFTSTTNTTTYSNVTGEVDFSPVSNNALIINSSGIFSSLTPGSTGTFNDFDYKGAGMNLAGLTLWSAGSFNYTVNTFNVVSDLDPKYLNISSYGQVFDGVDYTNTYATLTLTSTGTKFVFGSTATAVSEPATLALLGLGLAGLGVARRKQAKA